MQQKKANQVVVIDGCPVGCAKKVVVQGSKILQGGITNED
jgi:uncharacterized metal-binding protein